MVFILFLLIYLTYFDYINVTPDDLGSVEGECVMTIHQKLYYIIENGTGGITLLDYLDDTSTTIHNRYTGNIMHEKEFDITNSIKLVLVHG